MPRAASAAKSPLILPRTATPVCGNPPSFLCSTRDTAFFSNNKTTVVVAAKTVTDPSKPITAIPDPKSNESTITTVSYEIRQAGGEAHPVQVDVRSEESVNSLVQQTIDVNIPPFLVTLLQFWG